MMARLFHRSTKISFRKCSVWVLALCWSGGLICGILAYMLSGAAPMVPGMLTQVSVENLMLANLLPFLFSVFAVYIHQPMLILPIAFLRAGLFSFVSMGTLVSFGSAGWLVRILLMFSDLLLTVLLYFYWLRHIPGLRRFSLLRSIALAAVVVLVGSLDYCWMVPILAVIL